ncbi:ABC transporter ATP-binding protein [Sulfoacidibacillus thermotolerans]|uniref:Multidrug ABC transporter ATP-binding protein n=1 Tax=Sulfoacidibacillus thermotolerans TaxID=1765684 RepID=A0A2U3D824_SULT2|nr:ABC transporter transmembrane domain-containing protein [Sulfoacidibacillus thermotolerans]PWI57444.1 multidrug ABC transporter ATP-binding protein [Sulfoacidibacillus thermotolerans]
MDVDDVAVAPLSGSLLLRMLSYTKPHVKTLTFAFFVLVLATGSNVLGPILIKIFIDHYLVVHNFPIWPLVLLATTYLSLQLMAAFFNFTQLLIFQKVALFIIQQLRVDVFGKVQMLGLSFFDRTPSGLLVSRITNDTESIKDMYVSVLSTFVQNIVLLLGIYVSMFILDVRLALFCLALAPIIVAIMAVYRHFSSRIFHLARHRLSLLNAKLSESLQGMYIVQAMRQEHRLRAEFARINYAYRSARLRNIKFNSLLLRPLIDGLYLCTLILVLGFFGLQSMVERIDLGVLYAFVSYLEQFFEPVNQMMLRLNSFQQAMVSSHRVFHLLDEDDLAPRQAGEGDPQITRGEVRFEDVSFSYDGKTDVLKNISFVAKPGQTVALVGHTGSGKSSIANLLLRFYSVERGRITIDGIDLRTFANAHLRKKVGLVLQDAFIFVGDIRSNIRLGTEKITDQEVVAAAQFVQADAFIQKLAHGYSEPLGERGATLSAGQRQLLAFARTMAHNPQILVLDEATASVDTETEEAIQETLMRMRQGRTTIAIAHRLSTIQDADLILVLHHGEVIERGTHQELLAKEGLYHKMFLLQQGGRVVLKDCLEA